MSTNLSKEDMVQFLTDLHVAIISVPVNHRGPLTVPIWYFYEPGGEIAFTTFKTSWKAKLIKIGLRISLCVQDENPPYKYVSVEGPVQAIRDADLEKEIRPLVYRYLGKEDGDQYIEETYPDPKETGELLVQMKPERWYAAG